MADARDWQTHEVVDTEIARPPTYAKELVYAYGLAVLHWGRVEAFVDNILIASYSEAAKSGTVKRIPNAWRSKCEMLLSRFSAAEYDKHREAMKDAVSGLLALGGERNLVIHAGALGFSPGPPELLHLRKYEFLPNDEIKIRHVRAPKDVLYDFSDECIKMGTRLLPLVVAVAGTGSAPPPEQRP